MSAALQYTQRWREGAERWVPHRQVADTSRMEAALIEDDTTASAFVTTHHYSASYPAARLRVGLYDRGHLVGVAVYSEPGNVRTIPAWSQGMYTRGEGVDLGRFVLLDEVGFNAESWFFARARRLLREHKPEVRMLLATSDPVPRRTSDGRVVMTGHVGQIYQATNARYLGRTSRRALHLDRGGRVVSPRAISKIVSGCRGHVYARALLEEASATRQRDEEDARAWVARARAELQRVSHPGNHVYAWPMTRRDSVPRGMRAPRQIDPVQMGLMGGGS